MNGIFYFLWYCSFIYLFCGDSRGAKIILFTQFDLGAIKYTFYMCTCKSLSFLSHKTVLCPGDRGQKGWRTISIWMLTSFLWVESLEQDTGVAKL